MVRVLKNIFRPLYYFILRQEIKINNLRYTSKIKDAKDIPIVINNRNRLTFLRQLIEALEKRGCFNIYIIDNQSTYPPLLEFYNTTPYKVFFLGKNMGYLAIWKSGIYKQFHKDYYVYTDADVVPIEECPDDFMELFMNTLSEHKDVQKVGFSLKIGDLPDCFLHKEKVIAWEKKHFENKLSNLFYEAPIDTTFAMYRPGAKGKASFLRTFRTAYPYEARHMPWYTDSKNLDYEEKYYIEHSKIATHWTKKSKL